MGICTHCPVWGVCDKWNHWILHHLTRSVKPKPWPGGGGHEALFVATSDHLPSHPTKDGRATDSCFALIGAHQCGVLMVNAGWPAVSKFTPSETLVVSRETGRGWQSSVTERSVGKMGICRHCPVWGICDKWNHWSTCQAKICTTRNVYPALHHVYMRIEL